MKLISEPDGPREAFAKGAAGTGLAVGIPILIGGVGKSVARGLPFLPAVGAFAAMAVAAILIGGVGRALWSFVERWAYDRVTRNPFN